jgi:hypothetical protein
MGQLQHAGKFNAAYVVEFIGGTIALCCCRLSMPSQDQATVAPRGEAVPRERAGSGSSIWQQRPSELEN